MAELVVAVTLIALPDSLNPSLILTELVLAGGPHPRRETAVFTVAAMATTFVGGLAVALGLGELVLSVVPKPSPTLKGALAAGVGAALAVAGIALWLRRDRPTAQIDRDSVLRGAAALLGAGIAGIELATAFPYFAAISLVVGSDVSTGEKVVLLALYNVVYALPLIAIAAVCAVRGKDARRLLGPTSDWLMRRWPSVVAVLTLVVGIAVLAYGVAKLVPPPSLLADDHLGLSGAPELAAQRALFGGHAGRSLHSRRTSPAGVGLDGGVRRAPSTRAPYA